MKPSGSTRNPTGAPMGKNRTGARTMRKIRIAVAGVGNCTSALLQGIEFYRDTPAVPTAGSSRG